MKYIVLNILFSLCLIGHALAAGQKDETAYQRVLRTGILRCGYIVWPPYMSQDIAKKTFSGMNYDYTEAVAAGLGLKVQWTEEITPGSQVESLRAGKIDAICTAEGPMVPSTIKYLAYSTPMAYVPFYLYARAVDKRFDKEYKAIDKSDVRVAVIDGDVSGQLTIIHFPHAARMAMPQMSSPSQMMMDVATGKADIVINDPLSMRDYMAANPGKLKRIADGGRIAVIPNTFSVLRGEKGNDLLQLLNQEMENIKYTGQEAQIFSKYALPSDEAVFDPTADAYRIP